MAIKNIDELAKFVKGGAEVLQKGLNSDEEITLEFVDGSFVSDEQLDSLKTGQFNAGKKEGQTIGYDFAMKDLKSDFGLEIEGKDRKVIADNIKKKIMSDAKIEPDKKIQELNGSLERLQQQYNDDLGAKSLEIEKLSHKIKSTKINADLMGYVPEGLQGLKTNQFTMLAKSEFEFDYDDNGLLVAKKNGSILKDKLEKPLPISEILTDFASQNKWINTEGRGGGHQGGSSSEFKSINDVYRHMESNKIDPGSSEGERLIKEFKESQN